MNDFLHKYRCRYYGPDGEEISLEEWSELFERRTEDMSKESWWRIQTQIGEYEVSTVWLGLDHGFSGPPLFWETMVFRAENGRESEEFEMQRYSSRGAAMAGHEEMCKAVRAAKVGP